MHPADLEDTVVLELLRKPNQAEALIWLRTGGHEFRNVGELSPRDSVQLVEHLYAIGAEQVLAVDIDIYEEGQNTGKLLIKRPAGSDERFRLLEWANRHSETNGFMPDTERGQHYLFVWLD